MQIKWICIGCGGVEVIGASIRMTTPVGGQKGNLSKS